MNDLIEVGLAMIGCALWISSYLNLIARELKRHNDREEKKP